MWRVLIRSRRVFRSKVIEELNGRVKGIVLQLQLRQFWKLLDEIDFEAEACGDFHTTSYPDTSYNYCGGTLFHSGPRKFSIRLHNFVLTKGTELMVFQTKTLVIGTGLLVLFAVVIILIVEFTFPSGQGLEFSIFGDLLG